MQLRQEAHRPGPALGGLSGLPLGWPAWEGQREGLRESL